MKKLGASKIIEFSFLAFFVFGFRLLIEESIPIFEQNLHLNFGRFLIILLSNYPLTLLMLLFDVLITYMINSKINKEKSVYKIFAILFSASIIALISALWMRVPFWINTPERMFFNDLYFSLTLLTSFIFNLVIVSLLQVYSYYAHLHEKALNIEIGKKNKARYQYQFLKTQLNPHFLFNSLNVLDYLIQTDQKKASAFVRKLSSVYRYMLSNGENTIVTLREEIQFVNEYCELLKERFSDGLDLEITIPEVFLSKGIIPGGLQLLVENSAKHNIISSETPLRIEIFIEKDMIVVKNNIQPRMSTIDSSGQGMKNIIGQYKLLLNKSIIITSSENYFLVKLPLIAEI